MEIDTGSEFIIVSEYVFQKLSLATKIQLEPITCKLATFHSELLKVKGSCLMNGQYGRRVEPVNHLVWSTPTVTPVKPDESVRICRDYECTVNNALKKHAYLFSTSTYQQLTVDDATAEAQTIITHRGAFRVKRLQFGISTAPGIFQNIINKTVADVQGMLPYFDDIIIAASDEEELTHRLETVLYRLLHAALQLKSDKCKFCLLRVEVLGFEIDAI
ncbi:Uncharacterized protein T4E_2241 [Trichinella pseudospiralis]|uniref:Reverse transcriptase domain-containing protein n=1 Tax=Trichinella pseudospiralis TaxID=6337 RepID=A0A0V0YJ41_TRIPS|nr:Uncharacterized protein T4E_2241 [Trichinella pseudospiralis]